jgi:hypothetical protein
LWEARFCKKSARILFAELLRSDPVFQVLTSSRRFFADLVRLRAVHIANLCSLVPDYSPNYLAHDSESIARRIIVAQWTKFAACAFAFKGFGDRNGALKLQSPQRGGRYLPSGDSRRLWRYCHVRHAAGPA